MKDADVVVGSKRHPQSQMAYPLHRRFLSKCFNLLVRAMFNFEFPIRRLALNSLEERFWKGFCLGYL